MTEELVKPFVWIGKDGKKYNVTEMETRHLFYTIRMIWNHSAPYRLRLKPYHRYTFNSELYPTKYITEALKAMLLEISKRDDIKAKWFNQLNFMINYAAQFQATKQLKGGIND